MLGMMDLMTTMMTLKMNPIMRPRSTSTKTVDKNVTIHKTPSYLDLDQYFSTSPSFLKIRPRENNLKFKRKEFMVQIYINPILAGMDWQCPEKSKKISYLGIQHEPF